MILVTTRANLNGHILSVLWRVLPIAPTYPVLGVGFVHVL